MADHDLKTLPPYFEAVATGRKTFEVRWDDRGFAVGDVLRLREWAPRDDTTRSYEYVAKGDYTGRETRVRVAYILRGGQDLNRFGLQPGYVVLGIEAADAETREAVIRAAAAEAGMRVLTDAQASLIYADIDAHVAAAEELLADQDADDETMAACEILVGLASALRGEEATHDGD